MDLVCSAASGDEEFPLLLLLLCGGCGLKPIVSFARTALTRRRGSVRPQRLKTGTKKATVKRADEGDVAAPGLALLALRDPRAASGILAESSEESQDRIA